MGRAERIREDRFGAAPGKDAIGPLLPGRAALVLAVVLLLTSGLCSAGPGPVLTDLWDGPVDLSRVCGGRETLLLICDPGVATCREGAVYFDSKAAMIKAGDIRPVMILIGSPPEIRDVVLRLDIGVPVYIDATESVFESLLDKRILPALVLMDGGGEAVRSIYGGGDSLDGNIRALTETQDGGGRNWWLIIIPVAIALAILPFVMD